MTTRTEFIVDTESLSELERVDVSQGILLLLAEEVATFETDIPWSTHGAWADDVRAAATVLSSLRKPRRGETDQYRQTGIQAKSDREVWDAFVAFAPYAFDASAWATDESQIVSMSDCAESIVVNLTDAQIEHIGRLALPIRLRPTAKRRWF